MPKKKFETSRWLVAEAEAQAFRFRTETRIEEWLLVLRDRGIFVDPKTGAVTVELKRRETLPE